MLYSCANAHCTYSWRKPYTAAQEHTVQLPQTMLQLRQRTLYSFRKTCYSCARSHCTAAANHVTASLVHTVQLSFENFASDLMIDYFWDCAGNWCPLCACVRGVCVWVWGRVCVCVSVCSDILRPAAYSSIPVRFLIWLLSPCHL